MREVKANPEMMCAELCEILETNGYDDGLLQYFQTCDECLFVGHNMAMEAVSSEDGLKVLCMACASDRALSLG